MKLILFTAFIIYSLSSFAQTEPLIELIFEDTRGNKDTTIIGISELACDTMLSLFLGEERINAQLNDSSTFKVIGSKVKQTDIYTSHFLFREELFSKKIFFKFPPDEEDASEYQCWSGQQFILFKCRIRNFPLKITWNWLTDRQNDNFYGNRAAIHTKTEPFIIKDDSTFFVIAESTYPLFNKDSILVEAQDLNKWNNSSSNDYVLLFSLQRLIVGINELNNKVIKQLKVSPNPTATSIRLNVEETCDDCQIKFYNASGTFLKIQSFQKNDMDISDLPKGLIIGLITEGGSPAATFRFLKIE